MGLEEEREGVVFVFFIPGATGETKACTELGVGIPLCPQESKNHTEQWGCGMEDRAASVSARVQLRQPARETTT